MENGKEEIKEQKEEQSVNSDKKAAGKTKKAVTFWIILPIVIILMAGSAAIGYFWGAGGRPKAAADEVSDTDAVSDTEPEPEEEFIDPFADADPEDHPKNFPVNDLPYFIYVEKGSHTISVFEKDDDGLYTILTNTWITATGRTRNLTPTGFFEIEGKEEWHHWSNLDEYSPYASKYAKGLYIHGPIYKYKRFADLIPRTYEALGTNATSGCMRTEVDACYFIYENCDIGTGIKIVEGSPLGFTAEKPPIETQMVNPSGEKDPPKPRKKKKKKTNSTAADSGGGGDSGGDPEY
ncbi:MAG: L,D-transpeptidase [Oscillospiraceae bacterium]|nr:L,D-transpeptidase [Oscillospiraceae bacterium]